MTRKISLTTSPPTGAPTVRCAVYLRISYDREGRALGVARQDEDCHRAAARLGWDVAQVFCDNDLSASRFARKERPDWDRLVTGLAAGQFDALMLWETSRGDRKAGEWLDFLDLCRSRGALIHVTSHDRTYDVRYARDWKALAEDGIDNAYESEMISERIRRKINQLVEAGKIHNGGPRPFGYTRIYAGEGRRRQIIRDELNEDEAAIIRDCVERVLRGESLRSICRDLNERGILTTKGNRWSMQGLRYTLRSGRIAGLKEHRRQIVGEAEWPAIITREQHEQIRAILDNPARYTGRGPRKHYLSGLVTCSCTTGKPLKMRVTYAHNKPKYSCPPPVEGGCGKVFIDIGGLEKFIGKWVVRRASDPATLRELARREQASDSAAKALIAAIEKDEKRLPLLQAQLTDGDEDELVEVAAAVRKVRGRIQENRDRLARLVNATPLVGVDVTDIGDRWDHLSMERKRALARLFIERIIIHPTSIRGRFDYKRVQIVPR